jgi:streptogramin lyase
MTEFAVPTADAGLGAITAGPDGNLWFLENIDGGNAAQIGTITPAGTVTEYSAGALVSGLDDITAGPDGNLWFTCQNNCGVGYITTAGDVDTNFNVVLGTEDVAGITTGPDGNLWFGYGDEPDIGTMTPGPSGTATNFVANSGLQNPEYGTWAITTGPDGNLWFTEPNQNVIGVMTTSGAVTQYQDPSALGYGAIVAGPDGNLWFTEPNSDQIGMITTSGVITQYPIPSGNSPVGLTVGPDGNLWFTEPSANQIGMITTSGVVTEFPGPDADGSPDDIAAGPDGNVWFTDSAANEIVKITLASPGATVTSLSSAPNPSSPDQAVTYTATVAPVAPASAAPTGTVSFADGGTPITGCTSQALSGGSATCAVTYTSAGTHAITATYGGDSNFAPSPPSNTVNQLVSASAPVVTGISPAIGPAAGGTGIKIEGDNLCQVTSVNFGSVPAKSFAVSEPDNGSCTVHAVSPPGTGVVDVTVTSPGGTSATGSQDQFSYQPEVTSISPAFGPGAGGTPIGITGDNLCQVTGVNFGSAPATAFKVTEPAPVKGIKQPCTVRAVSPPGTGIVDVTLTSPGGTSATGSQDQFSYQ